MPEHIIQTKSLSFQYAKNRKVLDDISLNIPKGSIYGFLGPNGAGKSTTMRLLTGIIPEQGEEAIYLFNEPLKKQLPEVFHKTGALVESPALYLHLSAINNLRYIAKVRKIDYAKIPAILELVNLHKHGHYKVKQYSLGMKQRLAIAMALLSEPQLLLLDEPVNGLDPTGIVEIRKLLVRLNQEQGVTVFVSSHLLAEIEKMCTHVGIIHQGKLMFEGTMKELSAQSGKCKIQVTTDNAKQWVESLTSQYEGVSLSSENQFTVLLQDKQDIPAFSKEAIEKGMNLYELKIMGGLEEWFMTLTQN
jgi:ABC-type multidrug transport system ATPase subunit